MTEPRFTALEFERIPPAEQTRRAAAFYTLMSRRRTVRHFSREPLPEGLIETLVLTASTAPSGAHKQPWRFVLVEDPTVRREIRKAAEAEERDNYERRFPKAWLDDLAPLGTDWHKEFLETAPALVVVFRIDFEPDDHGPRKHYYVSESVGIAVGLFLTAVHNAGLASLTHTPSPMGFLSRILGRPANERPYVVLPIGYPSEDAEVPTLVRKPLEEVLIRVGPETGTSRDAAP